MPQIAVAIEAPMFDGHGALMMAAIVSAPLKCTTFGVPNALIARKSARVRELARSAMAMNCNPTSAPLDDPMIS